MVTITVGMGVLIVAAFAVGRRVQGGGLNRFAWWPRSTLAGRGVYALIAGGCALAWAGSPIVAAVVTLAWFGACCVGLFDSVGRTADMWRGCARGAVQCAIPAAALIALDAAGYLTAGYFVLLWPVIGAAMGPLYRLGWRLDDAGHGQATVWGEYLTGAAWGAGLLVALG